jgi:hypothetical protein
VPFDNTQIEELRWLQNENIEVYVVNLRLSFKDGT